MSRFELFYKNFTNFPCSLTWTVDGVKEMLEKGKRRTRESQLFQWKEYPDVSTRAILRFNQTEKTAYLWLRVDEADPLDDIKHFPVIYYVIESQRKEQVDIIVCVTRVFDWEPQYFLECEDFTLAPGSFLTDPAYNTNDSVVIRVYVEPPAMARRVYSYEGLLNWSLENFSKRKQKEINGLFAEESPYFYTGPKGYRVRVLVRAWDTLVRVLVNFCAGEFDDDLDEAFPHCTTVTLLHRSNPERNVLKMARHNLMNESSYGININIDEAVEELLEDDTLFYSVTIRPTTIARTTKNKYVASYKVHGV